MIKHIIITRIKFDDEKLFQKYFEVMKTTYIPSIKNQKNKNFEIAFIINEQHIPIIKEFFPNSTYFPNMNDCKKYCIDNQIQIQTRHDCDDWMSEDYVQKIQEICEKNTKEKLLINFKVYKLNYYNGEEYEHGINYKNNNFISMFLTLFQKEVTNFIYEKNHRFMSEVTKNIVLVSEKYVKLIIHENNIFSKISDSDKLIKKENNFELSVITPTFDNVEYLEEFINSVNSSISNRKVEFLVGVDNCLKTLSFLKENLSKFKNVNFFYFSKNSGPYIIRNTLSKLSKSEKLLFVDSDDLVNVNLIPKIITHLNENDVVRFKFYNFKNKNELNKLNPKDISHFMTVGQLGINKKILMNYNGFEPWVCEADSEFQMRETENKIKLKNISEILYYRRRHDKNITIKPETGIFSNIRSKYRSITNKKKVRKNIGPLPILKTSNTVLITNDNINNLIKNFKFIKNENLNFGDENLSNFKIITLSTFWNAERYVKNCIESLKSQTHKNFLAYFVDDMSTDNSYQIAKQCIGDDNRFILIKNTEKKFKTKNFIDVIRENPIIKQKDVIVELDGDDRLSDQFVLEKINKVFSDDNVWLCGTKWKDVKGNIGNYGRPNPEKARTSVWNFSHMRSFRAFLFREIKDEHFKINGEYFKGACDMAHAIPMLEMSGSEHFHYINEPLYTYTWHNNQSYSKNGGIGDSTTQSKTGSYIYGLPKYQKLVVIEPDKDDLDEFDKQLRFEQQRNKKNEVLNKLNFNFNKSKQEIKTIDYEQINSVNNKNKVYTPSKHVKPIRENKPNKRQELIELRKGNVNKQVKEFFPGKPNRRNNLPNIF